MTAQIALLGLMVMSIWAASLSMFRTRNWRGVGMAVAATTAVLLVGDSPIPGAGIIQGGIWAATMIILFTTDWVGVVAEAEYDFIERYADAMKKFQRPWRGGEEDLNPDAFLRELNAALHSVESLDPPTEWRAIWEEAVREMRSRIETLQQGSRFAEGDIEVARQRWLTLGRRFRELLAARAGFWAGFPRRTAGRMS